MALSKNGFGDNYYALGNYVHLHSENYNKYGVYWQGSAQKKEQVAEAPKQYIYSRQALNAWQKQQLDKIRFDKKDQKNLEELQNRTKLFSQRNLDKSQTEVDKYNEAMIKAIYKMVAALSTEWGKAKDGKWHKKSVYGYLHGSSGENKITKGEKSTGSFQIDYKDYAKFKKIVENNNSNLETMLNNKTKLNSLVSQFNNLNNNQTDLKRDKKIC